MLDFRRREYTGLKSQLDQYTMTHDLHFVSFVYQSRDQLLEQLVTPHQKSLAFPKSFCPLPNELVDVIRSVLRIGCHLQNSSSIEASSDISLLTTGNEYFEHFL